MNKVLAKVQELLKDEYEHAEKVAKRAADEWKHPQTEEEANKTLLDAGMAHGVKMITVKVSKLINEMTDEKESKNSRKFMDIKARSHKNKGEGGFKKVDLDEIPEKDKKEIIVALMEAFGFLPEKEDD